MEMLKETSEKKKRKRQNLEYNSSLIYTLLIPQLLLFSLAIPLALKAPTHSITKWWCWYFDDQFMSGWAGPCVWTHFHRFLLKTVQSFPKRRGLCQDYGQILARFPKKTERKKTGPLYGKLREEKRDWEGDVSKSFLSKPTSHHHLRKVSR